MPPKSSNKKNATVTWYHCDACDAHITAKARETHEHCCPIPDEAIVTSGEQASLEYIRNGVLYTNSVERLTLNIEALQGLPQKYLNNLLFLSEGAIRLAKMHIGQQVCVTVKQLETKLVRTIWPTPEHFQTTVFVTAEDLQRNWQPFQGKVVSIVALSEHDVCWAKAVRLVLQNADEAQLNAAQLNNVASVLKQEIKNLVYTKGSTIHLNFFNKSLKLRVLDWQGALDETALGDTLVQAFEQLSLDMRPTYFTISNATKLDIEATANNPATESIVQRKLISANDIGGLEQQIELVKESMEYALGFKKLPQGVKISRGLLLHGATGCGKTMICEAMCTLTLQDYTASRTQILRINSGELYSKFLGETERNLAVYFEQAYSHYPQPTLIVLEDVHNLCPKHETNEMIKRVSAAFLGMLDQLSIKREAQHCFLLATTSQIEALHTNIRRCGRLDCEIEIAAPTPQGRLAIINCLLSSDLPHDLTPACVAQIAQVTHGFVGADLANLVYSASLAAVKTESKLQLSHINAALTHIKPSAMREVLIECPNVHWSDIGGQAALKLKLQQAIEWPLLHPEKFARLGIKPPRGILMFGPPGCSKTLIAKALATESKLNFLSIKGPELFSMWVGESERAVREIFRKARQVAPAIVFFDEIDAIGGERAEGGQSGSGASVKERVLTQLLTELDGVETLQNVTIVAATNRPDMIDKALLRPGRIDRIVYVGLPDAPARREILLIKLAAMPLAADVDIDALVTLTAGYSGAELQAVCHEAALKSLEDNFDAEHVAWKQFEYALNTVQPRTSPDLLKLYEEYLKRS